MLYRAILELKHDASDKSGEFLLTRVKWGPTIMAISGRLEVIIELQLSVTIDVD